MKEDQNDIYYITGESIRSVLITISCSFAREDLEILYMMDPVHEYCLQQLRELDGTKPKSTTKEGLGLEDEDEKMELEKSQDRVQAACKTDEGGAWRQGGVGHREQS